MQVFSVAAKRTSTKAAGGFTLVEVLIVVAIIGILSAIAIPNYTDYVLRGSLAEATSALSDAKVRMEQAYADNRTYAGGGGGCGATIANTERFNITCSTAAGGQTFVVTATGVGPTAGFIYTINNQNVRTTISWGSSWGAVPAAGATRWLTKKS